MKFKGLFYNFDNQEDKVDIFLKLAKNHNFGNLKFQNISKIPISTILGLKSIIEDPIKLANFRDRYNISIETISEIVEIHKNHIMFLEFCNKYPLFTSNLYPNIIKLKKEIEKNPTNNKINEFNNLIDKEIIKQYEY